MDKHLVAVTIAAATEALHDVVDVGQRRRIIDEATGLCARELETRTSRQQLAIERRAVRQKDRLKRRMEADLAALAGQGLLEADAAKLREQIGAEYDVEWSRVRGRANVRIDGLAEMMNSTMVTVEERLAALAAVSRPAGRAVSPPSAAPSPVPTLGAAVERGGRRLALFAVLLPEDIRQATLESDIDALHHDAQTPTEVTRISRQLLLGIIRTAIQHRLGQRPTLESPGLWALRMAMGAVGGVGMGLGIVSGLIQVLGSVVTAVQAVALVVILAACTVLGVWCTARLEGRRRLP